MSFDRHARDRGVTETAGQEFSILRLYFWK
jgi:hypothetical protein